MKLKKKRDEILTENVQKKEKKYTKFKNKRSRY